MKKAIKETQEQIQLRRSIQELESFVCVRAGIDRKAWQQRLATNTSKVTKEDVDLGRQLAYNPKIMLGMYESNNRFIYQLVAPFFMHCAIVKGESPQATPLSMTLNSVISDRSAWNLSESLKVGFLLAAATTSIRSGESLLQDCPPEWASLKDYIDRMQEVDVTRAQHLPNPHGTVAELSQLLGVSKSEVRRLKRDGALDAILS